MVLLSVLLLCGDAQERDPARSWFDTMRAASEQSIRS
jgi:hypothetical protein